MQTKRKVQQKEWVGLQWVETLQWVEGLVDVGLAWPSTVQRHRGGGLACVGLQRV